MDVSELLTPETAYGTRMMLFQTVFMVLLIGVLLRYARWATGEGTVRFGVLPLVAIAVALGSFTAATLTFRADTDHREAENELFHAKMFEHYGLTERNWYPTDTGVPDWQFVQEAGSTGIVTTVLLSDDPRAATFHDLVNVKIALDGDRLTVTLPGGEEYAPAGGDTRE